MSSDRPVVAARDEGLISGERDVLRGCTRIENPGRASLRAVDGDAPLLTRRHPDGSPVWGEYDIVCEEGRCERADELRSPRVTSVEDGDPRGLRSESRPDGATVGAHRDMARRAGDTRAPEHAGVSRVDDDDLFARRIADVGVRASGMDSRIARCLESLQLGPKAEPSLEFEDRDHADLRVTDDRRVHADALDAPRARGGLEAGDDPPSAEVEEDDMTLQIRRDER